MGFAQWLKANGYDEAALTPEQRKHLEAAWKAETQPTLSAIATQPGGGSGTQAASAPTPQPSGTPVTQPVATPSTGSPSFDEKLAAIEAENQRIEYIENATIN